MSIEMDEEIKRWTARRKSALVLEIIQGKTTVSESSRQFDLSPSEVESWIDQAKAGMENALKAMLELRARKNGKPCWRRGTRHDPSSPAGHEGRRI